MKAALDVHYESGRSFAACVIFSNWPDGEPAELIRAVMPGALQYQAGRFYERELPCLLSVLKRAGREFEMIIIDGYVHLQPEGGKGLGVHLFEALSYSPAIVGVAKNPLNVADRFVPICRGRSRKPLFVSAIGCSLDQAARSVLSMHGQYRIPTLLRLADHHARGI